MSPLTFLINSTNPELDYLASFLCREGSLTGYLRRYANKGRLVERMLERAPAFRSLYMSSFGRRRLPEGLHPSRVTSAGTGFEFAATIFPRVFHAPSLGNFFRTRFDAALADKACRLVRNDPAEIVVGNYDVSWRAFAMAQRQGKKNILNYPITHHRFTTALLTEEASLQPEFASTIRGPYQTTERIERENQEIGLADRILVGSNFVKESFIWAGIPGQKIVVIPYGADTALFCPPPTRNATKRLSVIYAGHLTQRKGISYLLKAFESLHGSEITLRIAGVMLGDPGTFVPYHHLFAYLGHLDRLSLAQEFRKADVFVFPTLVEGMPLSVLEAMATGLPVVTTGHGPGDLVRDGIDGFVVPIRDPDAIVDKLIYLQNNPSHRLEMGGNARLRALSFTWDHYGARVTALLRELCGQGAQPPAAFATQQKVASIV